MKFKKIDDKLFTPLKKNEMNKIKGGTQCQTGVFTSRWIGNGVKYDGTETEEDPAAIE